ncbi:MAG TPA: heavy metal-associated domain-containing protein [Pyrinomonadaceae bacterium]|nr:heavy metal-associated domain-containing protein [Pyrinomonadaceae bacterium]
METQKTTTVRTPDITCGGCASSIKNALGKMEGVGQIEVDVNAKIVSIEHDAQVSREQIEAKLDDIGFPVERS